MKKLFFALACFVGLMTFASCNFEEMMKQKPEVNFVTEEGYFAGNTNVYLGTELKFKVTIAPNEGSESPLAHVDIAITDLTGTTVFPDASTNGNPTIADPYGENTLEWSYTPTVPSTYTLTFKVSDEAGKINVKTIAISVVQPVEAVHGRFKGELDIQGHLKSNEVAGFQAYDQDYEFKDVPFTISLGATNDQRIIATFDIEGFPVTLEGNLEGSIEDGTITFDHFHFNKTINLFVDVTLDLTMDVTSIIEGETITVSGTAAGTGTASVSYASLNVEMTNCVINGTLNKLAE